MYLKGVFYVNVFMLVGEWHVCILRVDVLAVSFSSVPTSIFATRSPSQKWLFSQTKRACFCYLFLAILTALFYINEKHIG